MSDLPVEGFDDAGEANAATFVARCVAAAAESHHAYFYERKQVSVPWEQTSPMYRHMVTEAMLKILLPVFTIVDERVAEVAEVAQVLSLRLDILAAEVEAAHPEIAAQIRAAMNTPIGD